MEELIKYIEERSDALYERIPDASAVENGAITSDEAITLGRYLELERLLNYIDELKNKENGQD